MNTVIWIVQVILGTMMLVLGLMKTLLPVERLNKFSWTTRISIGFTRFVGISELLIGLGLILPQLYGHLTHTFLLGRPFPMHDYGVGHCRTCKA